MAGIGRRRQQHGTTAANGTFRIVAAAGILFLAGCTYNGTAPKQQDPAQQYLSATEVQKVSPDLLSLFRNGSRAAKISVLVTMTSVLSQQQRQELEAASIHIATITGNVFTASLKLQALPLLARKPYVRTIVLSKKMRLLGPVR